ncbi:MAG: AI-2E family transporter [Candidatus Wildermuthbacteria bacterium]|nr:AI-2E family transporter [Candidatus Wildermuthbacteria bacterium]
MGASDPKLDISWGTIVKLSLTALLLYVFFLIKDILVWVMFGVIISLLFDPVIDSLQKRKIPRVVGTVSTYLFVFGVLAFTIYAVAPFFVNEIQRFSQLFPHYLETLAPPLQGLGVTAFSNVETFFSSVSGGVEQFSSNFFSVLFAIFGGVFSTIFVISIAIFLSLEEKAIERVIFALFPKRYEVFALNIWEKSQKKVSAWFVSRIVSSLFVGVAVSVSLLLFNVQYPFSLGLLSGVLNFIPIIGPLFAGAVIALLVSLDSVAKALFVVIAFTLIQQIEGNILTPILTKKFIGISPVLVLIALAIGGQLWGIMGALLAIPLTGILAEFLRDFLKKRKEEKTAEA